MEDVVTWWFWSCWGPSPRSSGRGPVWAQVDPTRSSNSLPGSLFVDSGAPVKQPITSVYSGERNGKENSFNEPDNSWTWWSLCDLNEEKYKRRMKTRKSIPARGRFCTDELIVKSWLEGAWRSENLLSDKHSVGQSESVIHSVVLNKIFTLYALAALRGRHREKKTKDTINQIRSGSNVWFWRFFLISHSYGGDVLYLNLIFMCV